MTLQSNVVEKPPVITHQQEERYDIKLLASIELPDGSSINGRTKNMSLSGAYIEVEDMVTLMMGEDCVLSLVVHDKPDPDELKFQCTVKHINNAGVGLQIESIYDDEVNDFLFLLANNSPNPNALLEAFTNHRSVDLTADELI